MYSVLDIQEDQVTIQLEGDQLTLTPQKVGKHKVTVQISDGEDILQYVYHLKWISWMAGFTGG